MTKRVSVTTGLELGGLVAVAVAVGLEVAQWTLAGGIAAGGVLLILESAFVTWRAPKIPQGDETA